MSHIDPYVRKLIDTARESWETHDVMLARDTLEKQIKALSPEQIEPAIEMIGELIRLDVVKETLEHAERNP